MTRFPAVSLAACALWAWSSLCAAQVWPRYPPVMLPPAAPSVAAASLDAAWEGLTAGKEAKPQPPPDAPAPQPVREVQAPAPPTVEEAAPRVEEPSGRLRHVLTIHPLPLALKGQALALEYELRLLPMVSLYLGPTISLRLSDGVIAAGVEAGGRWYPYRTAPEAYFVGAGLGYVQGRIAEEEGGVSASGVSLGVEGGYTFVWRQFWVLSLGLGLNYQHLASANEKRSSSGVAPSVRLAIGAGI